MNIQRKGITILAAVGFLVFLAGAGFSETAGSESHQAHHPQAIQGSGSATAGCTGQTTAMGGMMSGMMNSMMGNGMTASANPQAHSQSLCGHDVPHGCRNAESGT